MTNAQVISIGVTVLALGSARPAYSQSWIRVEYPRPIHLEVTQGIQTSDLGVPLVAGRATLVRSTLQRMEGSPSICNAKFLTGSGESRAAVPRRIKSSGRLTIKQGNIVIQAVSALNGGRIIPLFDDEENPPLGFTLDNEDHTLNFLLPGGLSAGSYSFQVTTWSDESPNDYCEENIGTTSRDISILPAKELVVAELELPVLPPMQSTPPPVNAYSSVYYAEALYPVSRVSRLPQFIPENSFSVSYGNALARYDFSEDHTPARLLIDLEKQSSWLRSQGLVHDAIYARILTPDAILVWPNFTLGQANIGFRTAWGTCEPESMDWVFAHEIAHSLGQDHHSTEFGDLCLQLIDVAPPVNPRPGVDVPRPGIDTERKAIRFNSGASYNGRIRRSSNQPPLSQVDIMTAGGGLCFANDIASIQRWVHPITLGSLYSQLPSAGEFPRSGEAQLLIYFIVDSSSWEVSHCSVLLQPNSGLPETAHDPAGALIVRATYGDGSATGWEVRTTPAITAESESSLKCVSVIAPATSDLEEISRIEILNPATQVVLATMERSPNSPAVSFDQSVGPTLMDGSVVSWTGSDIDGDHILYGLTFIPEQPEKLPVPLILLADTTSVTIDTSRLPRTINGSARLQLTATDGFNSTVVTIEGIAVDDGHPPTIQIRHPFAQYRSPQHVAVGMIADAVDMDDASAPSVAWNSDVDGLLGMGMELSTTLSLGSHVITATATDQDGMTASATTEVFIEPTLPDDGDLNRDGQTDCTDYHYLDVAVASGMPAGDCPSCDMDSDLALTAKDISRFVELFFSDCDANGRPDECDIAEGLVADCDENGIPDYCDLHPEAGFVILARITDPVDDNVLVSSARPGHVDIRECRVLQRSDRLVFSIRTRTESNVPPVWVTATYEWFLDVDSNASTGSPQGPLGCEYVVRAILPLSVAEIIDAVSDQVVGIGVLTVHGAEVHVEFEQSLIGSPHTLAMAANATSDWDGGFREYANGLTAGVIVTFDPWSSDHNKNNVPDTCEVGDNPIPRFGTAGGSNARTFVFRAPYIFGDGSRMRVKWRKSLDEAPYDARRIGYTTSMVFDENGDVYWRSAFNASQAQSGVIKTRASDGELLWSSPLIDTPSVQDSFYVPPIVGYNAVYGSRSNSVTPTVYALDKATGTVIWESDPLPIPVGLGMSLQNGVIYGVTRRTPDGNVHVFAIDADDGQILWQLPIQQPAGSFGFGTIMNTTLVPNIAPNDTHMLYWTYDDTGISAESGIRALRVSPQGGEQAWNIPGVRTSVSHVIHNPDRNVLYNTHWGDYGSAVEAIHPLTGDILWRAREAELGPGFNGGYFPCHTLRPDGSGFIFGGFSGNVWSITDPGDLAGAFLASDAIDWLYDGPEIASEPRGLAVTIVDPETGDQVYITGTNGDASYPRRLFAQRVNAEQPTGERLWEWQRPDDPAPFSSGFTPRGLSVGPDGTLYYVDSEDGVHGALIAVGVSPLGDMNCDGFVNLSDVDPFVLALLDPSEYAALYPSCQASHADMNNSGAPDAADIQGFISELTLP